MKVTLFSDDWYSEMISQQLEAHPEASEDARVQARAIMSAGAFIAQAIDHSFSDGKDGLLPPIERLAEALEAIQGGVTDFNAMKAKE